MLLRAFQAQLAEWAPILQRFLKNEDDQVLQQTCAIMCIQKMQYTARTSLEQAWHSGSCRLKICGVFAVKCAVSGVHLPGESQLLR